MNDLCATETLFRLIAAGSGGALLAPDRHQLDRAGLARQMSRVGGALASHSIGAGERVAIVLDNGPEMATAFLGVAAHASAAPLNPAYRAEEFAFYLDDLGAKGVILAEGKDSPIRAVAADRGLPLLELRVPEGAPAGEFELPGMADGAMAQPLGADAEALVLHTSGTTSRPKVVPLLQRNLLASARHIGTTLALGPDDRCLNIMPLFHIHGLIAGVLASLLSGGSVFCTPGFNALKFMGWLEGAGATWYTAVPTMHQAVLGRAARQPDAARAAGLRFVRSSSSSLPPQVMLALEETFGCPVIESYGMTEASHQMTSNLLPPGQRKAGTVGVPAGPEVRVVDEAWQSVASGEVGEVTISGPNVTPGYEANPKANQEAFRDGWFRTGDQGFFDADGFLTITGRLKEIINRGGEKISPREVDEVLLDHPAVGQAVTFALPHPKLGEEVAVAVVLKEGEQPDELALRSFAAARLADFKVPRRWVFLDEIPKGPTGKLQRIGLAKQLGLSE